MLKPEMIEVKTHFFYGYIILGAALTMWIICWGASQTFGIFFKSLSADLDLNRTVVSGSRTLSSIIMATMGAVTGRLSDRFGPRLVISIGGAFIGVGYCLMSLLNSAWQLYLYYGVLVGIGSSVVGPALMSTVSRWFVKRRGLAIAVVATGAGIGGMIFAPVSARLIQGFGWRYAYLILGAVCLVFMVGAGNFFRADPQAVGQLPDGVKAAPLATEKKQSVVMTGRGISLGEAVHTPAFWIFSCILLCFGLNRGITVHLAPHITDIGFSMTVASSVLAANAGVSIAGRLIMGQLADIIGGRRSIIITFILMPLAFLALFFSQDIWALYLFSLLYGISWGGLAVLRFSTAGELFGTSSLGAIMGVAEFFATAGSGAGPIAGGVLFDGLGNYRLIFLIFAVIGGIGFTLSLLLRPLKKI